MLGQYLRNQVKWEQTHLGNYRKVYPNKNVKRYKPIMEYLDRLKWPTLHKLPDELCKELNVRKPSKTNLSKKAPKEQDSLEMLDQIFKGLKSAKSEDKVERATDKVETYIEKVDSNPDITSAADTELQSETDTLKRLGKCYTERANLIKEEQQRREYWSKLSNSLKLDVMGKYNFIDRITYTKITGSRRKVAERYPMVIYPTVTVDTGGSREASPLSAEYHSAKSNDSMSENIIPKKSKRELQQSGATYYVT